jgi:SAM-dependent methyltransferase
MDILPPGTLLQLLYLKERLKGVAPGHFVEVGPGKGAISRLLLSMGWTGTAYDLESATTAFLSRRFASEISSQRYTTINRDWLTESTQGSCDLVISCMVMEHLDSKQERQFVEQARTVLRPGGMLVCLVPGSPAHWGIEDDIAGHIRRYTRRDIRALLAHDNWDVLDVAGLTWPVSNVLLPVSNWLVRRSESNKLALSLHERTKQSGNRDVAMKTHFPVLLGLILNKISIYPLHILQKLFRKSEDALVLYFEARKPNA